MLFSKESQSGTFRKNRHNNIFYFCEKERERIEHFRGKRMSNRYKKEKKENAPMK